MDPWRMTARDAWVDWMTRGDGGEAGIPISGDDRPDVASGQREEPAQAGGHDG